MLKRRYLAGKISKKSPRFARLEKKYGPLTAEAPVAKVVEPVSEVVEEEIVEKEIVKPKKKAKRVVKKKIED
jgi:hypothetical protein